MDASLDALDNIWNVTALIGEAAPTYIALDAEDPTLYCPSTVTPTANSSCTTLPPAINAGGYPLLITSNATVIDDSVKTSLPTTYIPVISNAPELMLALVRIDIGHILPNNFLVNHIIIDNVIFNNFPITGVAGGQIGSLLYDDLTGTGADAGLLTSLTADAGGQGVQLSNPDPAVIKVQFTCHFQEPKTAGTIFIATTVATLTFVNTGFTWVMFALIYFAKKRPDGM